MGFFVALSLGGMEGIAQPRGQTEGVARFTYPSKEAQTTQSTCSLRKMVLRIACLRAVRVDCCLENLISNINPHLP